MTNKYLIGLKNEVKNLPYIKEWIEALRSDKYKQINGKLSDSTNGRCCLGVYADLDPSYTKISDFYTRYIDKNRYDSILNICTMSTFLQSSLVNLNDRKKLTFKEIADILEISLNSNEEISENER